LGEEIFYSEEKFVSEYAATNPGEDIAKSLTYFILGQKKEHKKVKFFETYNMAVRLRSTIQSRIASYRE